MTKLSTPYPWTPNTREAAAPVEHARLYIGAPNGTRDDAALAIHHAYLITVLEQYVEGATITRGHGLWRGDLEPSWVVDVLGVPRCDVEALARALCLKLEQHAVYVTYTDAQGVLLSAE